MLCRWCGVTSEQVVLVHWAPLQLCVPGTEFRPVHDLRACPTPLVDRVEKNSYWVTEAAECVALGRTGFQILVHGVCECVTREAHFSSLYPIGRR